jgi:hypothetical protein
VAQRFCFVQLRAGSSLLGGLPEQHSTLKKLRAGLRAKPARSRRGSTIAAVAAATAVTAAAAAGAASVVGGKRVRWWAAANAVLIAVEALIVKLEWPSRRTSQRSSGDRLVTAHNEVPAQELRQKWRG